VFIRGRNPFYTMYTPLPGTSIRSISPSSKMSVRFKYACSFLPCLLHALSIASFLSSLSQSYLAKSTNYEPPNYNLLSSLLSLPPYSVEVFSPTPTSVALPCSSPQCERSRFTFIHQHMKNYNSVHGYFNTCIFKTADVETKDP
jgi:hypothetical protein